MTQTTAKACPLVAGCYHSAIHSKTGKTCKRSVEGQAWSSRPVSKLSPPARKIHGPPQSPHVNGEWMHRPPILSPLDGGDWCGILTQHPPHYPASRPGAVECPYRPGRRDAASLLWPAPGAPAGAAASTPTSRSRRAALAEATHRNSQLLQEILRNATR